MPRCKVALVALLLGIFPASSSFAQNSTSVKYVYTVQIGETAKHHALVQTGFRLAGTKGIVTSLHGVVGASSISAFNESGDAQSKLTIAMVDVNQDVALLRSEDLSAHSADGYKACTTKLSSGDVLTALGHPAGINLYPKQVKVNSPQRMLSDLIPPASARVFGERRSPAHDISVLSTDGNLVAGFSGAPLIDSKNEVCGVVDGGLLGGAAGISWAIQVSNISWMRTAQAASDLQRLANLDIRDLFAVEVDTIGDPIEDYVFDGSVLSRIIASSESNKLKDLTNSSIGKDDDGNWPVVIRLPFEGHRCFIDPDDEPGQLLYVCETLVHSLDEANANMDAYEGFLAKTPRGLRRTKTSFDGATQRVSYSVNGHQVVILLRSKLIHSGSKNGLFKTQFIVGRDSP